MGRAPCCDKANVKKGPWSPEEDSKLKDHIEQHGTGGNWITLPQRAGLKRCGKSCRLRWLNYLRPNIKHGEFSEEEDRIICSLYANIGSRWSIIAAQLPGRTDNDIKNYWNTKLKKKLMGLQLPPTISHHQKPSFPSHSSLSSSIFRDYYSSFTGLEPLPFPSSNYNSNTTSISLPFHQNQDHSLVSVSTPMQYYPNSTLYVFGSEVSCGSSDGSCSISHGMEIKQEEMGFQNYMSSGFEEYSNNSTFMLNQRSINSDGISECINPWEEKSNECFFQTPLGYDLEIIKQLISSSDGRSNNGYFCSIDENKTENY